MMKIIKFNNQLYQLVHQTKNKYKKFFKWPYFMKSNDYFDEYGKNK